MLVYIVYIMHVSIYSLYMHVSIYSLYMHFSIYSLYNAC